ncbi:FecCD family ABC transporter permease [Thalassotalea ganghwensis]
MATRLSRQTSTLILLLISVTSIILAMGFGSAELGFKQLIACLIGDCEKPIYNTILTEIRLPRVLMGFLAGFALAGAGALMQNVTRNPLADPYLFGIVAGAGLGATIAGYLPEPYQVIGLPLAAFIGAMLAVAIVVIVIMQNNWRKIEHLLLAGVAVSFLLSAVTSFILYFGEAFASNRVIFWLMGSLSRADYHALMWALPVIMACFAIALVYARQLDALLLSDESARTLGVHVEKLRILTLVLCAAMTAVIVSFCGGIGFVGLMIPHIVRPFFGLTAARLLISAGIIGGCFLVWVDVFARTIIPGQEIPIGVITSVIGSVFFLMLMRRV